MSYGVFAQYYDALTKNVNYEEMADYLCALLEREGHKAGLTLDLACGTGSLTLALAKRGIDVYGADASMEMLSVAQEKAAEAPKKKNIVHVFRPQNTQNAGKQGRKQGGRTPQGGRPQQGGRAPMQGKPMQVNNGRPAKAPVRPAEAAEVKKAEPVKQPAAPKQEKPVRTEKPAERLPSESPSSSQTETFHYP